MQRGKRKHVKFLLLWVQATHLARYATLSSSEVSSSPSSLSTSLPSSFLTRPTRRILNSLNRSHSHFGLNFPDLMQGWSFVSSKLEPRFTCVMISTFHHSHPVTNTAVRACSIKLSPSYVCLYITCMSLSPHSNNALRHWMKLGSMDINSLYICRLSPCSL